MKNDSLSRDRVYAHNIFDRLWKKKLMGRSEAYRELSLYLGKKIEETHMKLFNSDECVMVVKFATERLSKLGASGGLNL